jgi:hypothetical protein
MNTNDDRDQFLAEQAQRIGEPILAFSFGRILDGPPLESEMVFLMVGTSALHILPTVRDATVFGMLLPGRKKAAEPTPLRFARDQVVEYDAVRAQGLWAKLTAPQEVIQISAKTDAGVSTWKVQLIGEVETLVKQWRAAWG